MSKQSGIRSVARLTTLLLAMVFVLSAAAVKRVYYDNSETKWDNPYVHYWGGDESSWPGVPMVKDTEHSNLENIWYYNVPDGTTGILFNAGDGDNTKTSDFDFNENHVYKKDGGDKGLISNYSQSGEPEPQPDVTYTVYYENSTNWSTIKIYVWGNNTEPAGGWSGTEITGNYNSEKKLYYYTFTGKAGVSYQCIFNNGGDGNNDANKTGDLELINNYVYNKDGKKCAFSDYVVPDPNPDPDPDPDPDPTGDEYWLDPALPTQSEKAILYFDRTKGDGALKNTDEIYVWIGLITGDDDTKWENAPTCDWGTPTEKYKMMRVNNSNIYSLTFDPTIEGWFGADPDKAVKKIGVIFRSKDGNTRQDKGNGQGSDGGNHYIPLKPKAIDPSSSWLGSVQSYSDENGTVTVTSSKGKLMITPYGEDIVKIFTQRNGDTSKERASISVLDNPHTATYTVTETESDGKSFLNVNIDGGTRVAVDKESTLITFYGNDGETMLREREGLKNNSGNRTVSFEAMGDDAFYGGGYNGGWTNWDGKTMRMNNTQTGNWYQSGDGDSNYPHNICVPYYVSSNGYGILFDDHYVNVTITPSSAGSTYQSASEAPVSYYYVGGGSMEKAMSNYVHLTGHQELPPYWALGYLTSKYSFASEDEAKNCVTNTRNINIPVDALVFDIHWQGGTNDGAYGMGALDWHGNGYSNGDQIIKTLAGAPYNVKTVAITEPYFNSVGPSANNYNTLKNNGWLADKRVNDNSSMSWIGRGSDVGLIDVHNPAAMEWFANQYVGHTRNGMAGWWLDLGEPEGYDNDGDTHHMGTSNNHAKNEFGLLWIAGVYNKLKQEFPDQRHILLPRAGTSGMQRYSTAPWTGDIQRSWGGLAAQVPALVNSSMSGIGYLGSDIGGFIASGTDANLYLRWVQLGVFYPMMRTHSSNNPEPWRSDYNGVQSDVRKFIRMRYSYLPYTYSLSYNFTANGSPIARPANFGDADKSRLKNVNDAYLWGRDLYVAPVLSYTTQRDVKFPDNADWLDLNSAESGEVKVYQAGTQTSYSAPLEKLPYFLRRGAFITRYADQSNYRNTDDINKENITVDYFASNSSKVDGTDWFEDDHKDPNSVKNGKYCLTKFSGLSTEGNLLITMKREGNGYEGMPAKHNMILRIFDYSLPADGRLELLDEGEAIAGRSSAPRKAAGAGATTMTLKKYSSESDLNNGSENGYYASGNKVYLRLALEPARNYALAMGTGTLPTGIEAPVDLGAMTISYGGGYISYSAPEGTERLSIEVFSTTGMKVAEYGGLNADGYVNQIQSDLEAGVYVLRMTGWNAAGETRTVTSKVMAR